MPLIPLSPPVTVNAPGGFDYVTVDAAHRRVYAAHGGASSLLVVDADTGKVLSLITVGRVAGNAPEADGNVFTGNGDDESVSEVNPVTQKVLRTVKVDGHVDAIAYDATLGRIYADEDDGTRIFVIDAKTFKQIGTVKLPGHKPEYIVVDPKTHDIYQNIANLSEIAVIDPKTLTVTRTIPTPEIVGNHPLQYDVAFEQLLVGGENGKLSVYTTAGKRLYTIDVPKRIDQCSLDQQRHLLACAGGNKLSLIANDGKSAPKVVAEIDVANGVHNVGIDPKTGHLWIVWGERGGTGAYVQGFAYRP